MSQPLDFQSIMLTLQRFWAEQGCLIWQPYYSQVGAGTMNPATFLRVLGPEPWNVAYVEPSVRPDDGRYGENPNRLQQHYQFQVILKPDPGNPQELYLKSLEALGIDSRQHDIRFVEDNWESPALGAWGLGWEVWLDGQEITQFTYFQQAGGYVLNPVSVELTYGLERIAMALQRVRNFRDLRWNGERTYGDVNLAAEQEHSKYYFEIADVERLRKMYNLFEAEGEAALSAGLVLPAHDYILKCSHTFNVLDTRGAVGVTERQALFGRMRDLAHRVSEAYLNQRQSQEYPWMVENETGSRLLGAVKPGRPALETPAYPQSPADFLLEVGVEELPAADLESALSQLAERVPAFLDELRLGHGEVRVLGTPRRLVVHVAELEAAQPDRTMVVKGPPASRAFDAFGQPTKAAEGFARSKGVEVVDLQVREIDGGQYAAAVLQENGKPAAEVLAAALPGLIAGLKFEKTMRWNASGVAFSRPIRWLLALLGGVVVPFEYAGLHSNNRTRGLRFYQPEEIEVESVQTYFDVLAQQGIQVNPLQRRKEISRQAETLAREVGGSGTPDQALLDEVNNLVEAPTALLGSFDAQHLQLPAEVLVSVMKKHQRYFPIQDQAGRLLPHFIIVRNGDRQHLDVVADGNEQVIRARFADAAFFIREDLHQPLHAFLPRLGTLTFQVKLGSMLDKTHRIEHLVERLLTHFNVQDEVEQMSTRRAAQLCKADLVTKMVVEMTSLQGIIGRYYALNSGEQQDVAQVLYEHYLPRYTGDAVPSTRPGLWVGLADRLDTLSGLFAAGLAPSGTKDPFAQRRAALGLVQVLIDWDLDFDLRRGIAWAAEGLDIPALSETQAACLDFIVGRLRSYLMDAGFRYDVVDAVLAAQQHNPAGAARAVRQLTNWVARSDWTTILPAYARCVRITRDQVETYTVDEAAFVEPVESELFQALISAEKSRSQPGSVDDFLACFVPLIPVINRYFEQVMVMVDDSRIRANRLGTLQRVGALATGAADLSLLEGF